VSIRRILFAVGSEDDAGAPADLVADLASSLSAETVVLHVRRWLLGPSGPFEEDASTARLLAHHVAGKLERRGILVRRKTGSAFFTRTARAIVDVAVAERADLVVVGSRPVPIGRESPPSKTAIRVLEAAPIPVIVAPRKRAGREEKARERRPIRAPSDRRALLPGGYA
jgi:nucleotide-binding universal stress UspA family protein